MTLPLVVTILAVLLAIFVGLWQRERTHRLAAERQSAQAQVALQRLVARYTRETAERFGWLPDVPADLAQAQPVTVGRLSLFEHLELTP